MHSDQVVSIISEAFWGLGLLARKKGMPVTFISGPSATSGIELDRVERVHDTRRLHVLIV